MITRVGAWAFKAAVLWVALVVGSMLGGLLVAPAAPTPPHDGPFSSLAALLIVATMNAAVLAGVAARARVRGLRLALFFFAIFFGVQTFMMQIETAYFSHSVGMPWGLLARVVAAGAVAAAIAASTAAAAFRPNRVEAVPANSGLAWRIPVVAATYVGVYFAAGAGIAWQSAALRAYYHAGGVFGPDAPLIAFQFVRGALWALLVLLMVRNLRGGLATRAVLTALAFSALAAPQLLYPNPFMPWAVRLPHLIEVGVSNAVFGGLAAILLAPPAARLQRAPALAAGLVATGVSLW